MRLQLQGVKWNRAVIIGLFALQFVVLLFLAYLRRRLIPDGTETLQLYHEYSLNLLQGQVPYRDFPMEYPPLALLPMVIPQLVKLGQMVHFLPEYEWFFMLENILLSIVVGLILVWVALRWKLRQRCVIFLALYVLLVIVNAPVMLGRYDIFCALLTILAMVSVMVGHPAAAGVWLGLGIAAKLYPIVLLPIFGIYYLASREYRKLRRLLMGTFGATCVLVLPFVRTGIGELLLFLRYHQLRGLQLESIPSGIILLGHKLGLTKVSIVSNYGAKHLASPFADNVMKWLPLISILAFVGVIITCLICFQNERLKKGAITDESLLVFIVVALLTFIVTGKVFSPQYIIWLLPFAPLLRPRQVGLLIAISTISIVIYPFLYDELIAMQTFPVMLLNLRNSLVGILLFWLVVERLLNLGQKIDKPTHSA